MNDEHDKPEHAASTPSRSRRASSGARAMRIVRRTHMYLGLVLFPWVLLYGISGVLYNHPQIGRDVSGQRLSPEHLKELSGFDAWDPAAVAGELVEVLNRDGARYEIDPETPPVFRGWALLSSPAADGSKHVLIVNLEQGGAILAHHGVRDEPPPPPFRQVQLRSDHHSMVALQERVSGVLQRLDIDAPPLRAHPKVSPELQFRLRDDSGERWNAVYDLGSGRLDGRRTDADGPLLFVELLEKLHQQHHFPGHFGPTFWWAVFADLTGLAMASWALSGLVMWWQMKRLRVAGAISVAIAIAAAAWLMSATSEELQWNPEVTAGPG